MKVKKIIKIPFAIMVIGLLLSLIALMIGGFNKLKWEQYLNADRNYIYNEKTFGESEFLDVNFIMADRNLVFKKSYNDKFNVSYYEADFDKVNIETKKGTINIETENRKKGLRNLLNFKYVSEEKRKVIIEIPNTFINLININANNSNISIEDVEILNIKNINVKNGNLNIINTTINEIAKINIGNGNFSLKNTDIKGNLNIVGSNSACNISDINISGNLDLNFQNGFLDCDKIIAKSIKAESENGTSTLSNLKCNDITALNSNGNIDISVNGFYDDYEINIQISNGSAFVNGKATPNGIINNGKSNKILAKNTNGNIYISFLEKSNLENNQ